MRRLIRIDPDGTEVWEDMPEPTPIDRLLADAAEWEHQQGRDTCGWCGAVPQPGEEHRPGVCSRPLGEMGRWL